MIHYALRCAGGHSFDGWFPGSASFETQAQRGLLSCPVCADTAVERALMAPNVRTRAATPPPEPAPAKPAAQAAKPPAPPAAIPETSIAAPPRMPDQVRAVLQRIRAEVEKTCDYVGPNFAETARQIHAGIEKPRPIYGETTPEEAAALQEDGIETARIPWVPRANS